MKIVLFLAGWLGAMSCTFAQLTYGVGIGTTGYSGDLNDASFGSARYSVSADLGYKFNDMLQLYGSATFYEISAKDAVPQRNINFRSRNIEGYVGTRIFLTSSVKTFVKPKTNFLLPFFFGGIGMTTMDPFAQNGKGEYVSLRQIQPEGKVIPSTAIIYPLGFGLRVRMLPSMYLSAEGGLRIVNSDLLDGITTDKVRTTELKPEARTFIATLGPSQTNLVNAMATTDPVGGFVYKNGNPARKDMYGVFQFRIEIIPAAGTKSKLKYNGRVGGSSIGLKRKPTRRLK